MSVSDDRHCWIANCTRAQTARPSAPGHCGHRNGPTIVPQSYGEKVVLHFAPFSLSNTAFPYELLIIESVLITHLSLITAVLIHIFISSKLNHFRNVTYVSSDIYLSIYIHVHVINVRVYRGAVVCTLNSKLEGWWFESHAPFFLSFYFLSFFLSSLC